jgi:hypothetical protein
MISLRLTTLKIDFFLGKEIKSACTIFFHQLKSGIGKDTFLQQPSNISLPSCNSLLVET